MYRLSFFGAIHLAQGRLVWNDALGHQQFPLSEAQFRTIGAYLHPPLGILDPTSIEVEETVINDLVDRNVLVRAGSNRAALEEELMTTWQGWGTFARLYHFSSRLTANSPFLDDVRDKERLSNKLELFAPPSRWSLSGDVSRADIILLPHPKRTLWDFVDVLQRRRTPARIVGPSVHLDDFSTLLKFSAGLDDRNSEGEAANGNYYRYAPSGGARASVEVFLCVRDVDGLQEGCYWYLADLHGLVRVSDLPSAAVLDRSLHHQDRLTGAPFFVVVASNLSAIMWKYQTGRAYRDLFWDAGHVGQILQMTASALGLASAFTIVQDDEAWEDILNLDVAEMPVIGVYAVGFGQDRSHDSCR